MNDLNDILDCLHLSSFRIIDLNSKLPFKSNNSLNVR